MKVSTRLESVIKCLKKKIEENDESLKNLYDEFGYEFKQKYEYGYCQKLKEMLPQYEKDLAFAKLLEEANIETEKRYYLVPNVYFEVFYADRFNCYFYVDDDNLIYDYYIDSHSGINEWVTKLICDEFDLFSGNSTFNYAFGTYSLKDAMKAVGDAEEDNKTRINNLKAIISFVTNENDPLHKVVADILEYRFNKMEEFSKNMD